MQTTGYQLMARISDSLKLTESELDEFMRNESRLRIATIGPGTEINLTPMTFGWANGLVYIFGRGQKVVNLRREATATILVDGGTSWRELRGHNYARPGESTGRCGREPQ